MLRHHPDQYNIPSYGSPKQPPPSLPASSNLTSSYQEKRLPPIPRSHTPQTQNIPITRLPQLHYPQYLEPKRPSTPLPSPPLSSVTTLTPSTESPPPQPLPSPAIPYHSSYSSRPQSPIERQRPSNITLLPQLEYPTPRNSATAPPEYRQPSAATPRSLNNSRYQNQHPTRSNNKSISRPAGVDPESSIPLHLTITPPSIIPEFEIDYPNNSFIFTPQFNVISGKLHIHFLKSYVGITAIDVGLRGSCSVLVNHTTKKRKGSHSGSSAASVFSGGSNGTKFTTHTAKTGHTTKTTYTTHTSKSSKSAKSAKSSKSNKSKSSMGSASTKTVEVIENENEFELFDHVSYLFTDDSSNRSFKFPAGNHLELLFNVGFPKEKINDLPSSTDRFGGSSVMSAGSGNTSGFINAVDGLGELPPLTDDQVNGHVTVKYELYVKVHYSNSKNGPLEFLEYVSPVKYQDAISIYTKFANNYTSFHTVLFKNKVRQLIPDKKSKSLVGNPDKKKKWRDDVRMRLIVEIPKILNLAKGLEQIHVLFEFPYIHDFTHFQQDGVSTRLGLFEIEAIEIRLVQHLHLQTKEGEVQFDEDVEKLLYKCDSLDRSRNHVFVDVADFTFLPKVDCYAYKTTLDVLAGGESNTMLDFLNGRKKGSSTVVGNFKMEDASFTNANSFKVRIKIGNSQENGYESFWFDYERDVVVISHCFNELYEKVTATVNPIEIL